MVLLGGLYLVLAFRDHFHCLGSHLVRAASWKENGVIYSGQITHQRHIFEVLIQSKRVLNVLRKIHGIVPTDVIGDDGASFDAVIVLLLVVRPQVLAVVEVDFLVLGPDTCNQHPQLGRVSVQATQNCFSPALLQRALIEIVAKSKQSKKKEILKSGVY